MRHYFLTFLSLLILNYSNAQELQWLIPPTDKYEEVNYFFNGLARVKIKTKYSSKYGFINTKGETVIPFIYDAIGDFSEGLALYGNPGYWNFIDTSGKVELPNMKYERVYNFINGKAIVTMRDKYYRFPKRKIVFGKNGIINKKGDLIVPAEYDQLEIPHDSGLIYAYSDKKFGVFDSLGKILFPFQHGWALGKSNGLFCLNKNGKYGFVDIESNTIIPFEYDIAHLFSEGLAYVEKDNCNFIIDKDNKIKLKLEDFELRGYIRNGLLLISRVNYDIKKTEQLLIDTLGNILVSANEYDFLDWSITNESFKVVNDKAGIIDSNGKLIIPMIYDNTEEFFAGIAKVTLSEKIGYINILGKVVIPIEFDDAIKSSNNTIWLKKGNKWGLVKAPTSK